MYLQISITINIGHGLSEDFRFLAVRQKENITWLLSYMLSGVK